jgi:hypothetical protein
MLDDDINRVRKLKIFEQLDVPQVMCTSSQSDVTKSGLVSLISHANRDSGLEFQREVWYEVDLANVLPTALQNLDVLPACLAR